MNCPNCNVTLVIADRQGIEIDYCPQCRGVWLDRGELDKIIERSAGYTRAPETGDFNNAYKPDHRDHPSQHQQHYYGNDPKYRHKKKKGFLSDFFDFD